MEQESHAQKQQVKTASFDPNHIPEFCKYNKKVNR